MLQAHFSPHAHGLLFDRFMDQCQAGVIDEWTRRTYQVHVLADWEQPQVQVHLMGAAIVVAVVVVEQHMIGLGFEFWLE